ncbi:MAG: hypothetical protein HGB14_02165 [Anaerolineaceae bacterium]|nr:hypothetical protein [Anaerolineaceae bacterium]
MKRSLVSLPLLFGALLLLAVVTPGPAHAAPQAKLVITGTGSAVEVMQVVAQGFQKKHPGTAVEIPPSIGSGGGIKAVREGKIDIGLSARPLKPEERSPGVVEEAYGRTAFLFGAQASNPEGGFSLREIEEIPRLINS